MWSLKILEHSGRHVN